MLPVLPTRCACLVVCRLAYIRVWQGGTPMAQRSDAKQKMVQAAKQLMRERGYNATAFSDVLKLSGAPRGSVYFHFPGGKAELASRWR
jgi:AcrR family transcriptional regulator